jgi:hypothetical protein
LYGSAFNFEAKRGRIDGMSPEQLQAATFALSDLNNKVKSLLFTSKSSFSSSSRLRISLLSDLRSSKEVLLTSSGQTEILYEINESIESSCRTIDALLARNTFVPHGYNFTAILSYLERIIFNDRNRSLWWCKLVKQLEDIKQEEKLYSFSTSLFDEITHNCDKFNVSESQLTYGSSFFDLFLRLFLTLWQNEPSYIRIAVLDHLLVSFPIIFMHYKKVVNIFFVKVMRLAPTYLEVQMIQISN